MLEKLLSDYQEKISIIIDLVKSDHSDFRQTRIDNEYNDNIDKDITDGEIITDVKSALSEILKNIILMRGLHWMKNNKIFNNPEIQNIEKFEMLSKDFCIRNLKTNNNIIVSILKNYNKSDNKIYIIIRTLIRKKDFKVDFNTTKEIKI